MQNVAYNKNINKFQGGNKMFIEERHQAILELLEKQNKVILTELAANLNVSIDTIRRDLIVLEEHGLLKRTRGGAIPAQKVSVKQPRNYTVREIKQIDPFYDAIARFACSYIEQGDTVYIAGSSIEYLMVKYMTTNFNYTVITNSVIVADELKGLENVDVYITCGKVRGRGTMNDQLAIEFIRNMRIDKAFIGGAVLSAKFGLSNVTFETAILQRAVIEVSKKTVCLVPNIKLGAESFAKITDARNIDMVITDWEAIEDEVLRIRDLGVEVVVVEEPKE